MNWHKGLFRLWVVASGLWITLIGWAAYTDYTDRNTILKMQEDCARYYFEHRGSENMCFAPAVEIIPFDQVAYEHIALAIVPPALVGLVGLAALRARASSRTPPAQSGAA
jgi:hypothetical protein